MSTAFDPTAPPRGTQSYSRTPFTGSTSFYPPSHSSASPNAKKAKPRPSFHPPPSALSHEALPLNSPPTDALDLTKVRAYAACRNCRAKKIKCLPLPSSAAGPSSIDSGASPGPCQQCSLAGTDCNYPPTRDRAAYSRQYVQNLEARVQALEMLSSRMVPVLQAFEERDQPPPGGAMMPLPNGSNGGGAGLLLERLDPVETGRYGTLQVPRPDRGPEEADTETVDEQNQPPSDADGEGQMTHDERGNPRWIGPSNILSLLESFGRCTSDRPPSADARRPNTPPEADASRIENPYFGPVAGAGVVQVLPTVDEVSYPSDRAAEEMIDAFFAEVHPALPVVVEHEFREGFKELQERRARQMPQVAESFISVVFAIFALGERVIVTSRAWQRERAKMIVDPGGLADENTVLPGEAEAGVIWYERAQILHYTTLKDVNIEQVQCLTLMAAFQASVNAMPMSWLLAGQALRVAQDLGLHRSTARLRLSLAEKQLRSRCWWAIYGLERMVSITLGRPLGVDDLDIDVAYPAPVDDAALRRLAAEGYESHSYAQAHLENADEPLASVMSGFIALTKLCKIAGKVAHVLYRPPNGRSVSDPTWAASQQATINKLDKLLRDWLASEVPMKYKDASTIPSVQLVSAVLSNSYFAIRITLHRNFLPANPEFPRPKPHLSSQSLSNCVDAARSVIYVAAQSRILVPPSHHIAVFCQYLWSSAVILLLCEVRARDQVVMDAVGSQVEACRRALRLLEPVWPGCKKLKELLGDVESRAKEVVVAVSAPMPVVGSSAGGQGKKRKQSGHEIASPSKLSMGPMPRPEGTVDRAASRDPSSTWQHPSRTMPGDGKRHRVDGGRYETSDTRTIVRDDDFGAASRGQAQPQPQLAYPSGPSGQTAASGSMSSLPLMSPIQQQAQQGQSQLMLLPQPLFDVGGVNFNGLDMLQGFTGDMAAFWASLGDPFMANPAPSGSAKGGAGNGLPNSGSSHQSLSGAYPISGQATPTSSASGHGPSPTSGGAGWQFNPGAGHGTPGTGAMTGSGGQNGLMGDAGVGGMEDFWSQVTGTQFDWGADPSVPFNI